MCLVRCIRQLNIWHMSNADVPESTQFQDLVETLKLNREKKGLVKYVSEHILTTPNTAEKYKTGTESHKRRYI